jgi:hypothetical protein
VLLEVNSGFHRCQRPETLPHRQLLGLQRPIFLPMRLKPAVQLTDTVALA